MLHPGVPNQGPICEYGDYECVVHLAPVEEVEASDGVAKDANPTYGGAGPVCHDLDVWHPVEVPLEEDPQEPELADCGNVLWASKGVSIAGIQGFEDIIIITN